MALYLNPKLAILKALGDANSISLSQDDYDFGVPETLTPEEAAVAGGDANTKVIISANNNAAPYQGQQQVTFTRLDFADVAAMVDFTVRSSANESSFDVIPAINRRFGMVLSEADIEHLDATDKGGYKEVIIRAKADSLGWVGEALLTVLDGDLDLPTYLTNLELDGIDYPTPYLSRAFANIYSYPVDFSVDHDDLKAIVDSQTLDIAVLAQVVNKHFTDPWVGVGQADYSVAGATLVYAGEATDEAGYNGNYDYVVQVKLATINSLAIAGDLILHFNKPIDFDI